MTSIFKDTLAKIVKITSTNVRVHHVSTASALMGPVISNALAKLDGLVNIVTKTLTNVTPTHVTMVVPVSTLLVLMNASTVLLVPPSQTAKIKSMSAKSIM